tara:strand:- start:3595 stop:3804 length:210 start_codon:yes stop_codon:yes gene_type:complete
MLTLPPGLKFRFRRLLHSPKLSLPEWWVDEDRLDQRVPGALFMIVACTYFVILIVETMGLGLLRWSLGI